MSQLKPDPWRAVANDSYGAASELAVSRRWRSAISRAYYAAYSLVCGHLREIGLAMPGTREGAAHARLPELVEGNLTVLRVQDRCRVASRLRALYAMRIAADYWPSSAFGEAEVMTALYLMGDVFRWLKEKAHGQSRQ